MADLSHGVLALDMTGGWWMVVGAVGIAVLGVAWFGIRFWLASTRPADIKEVHTPNLDRLNRQALERMGQGDEEEEDEEVPEGLQGAAPGGEGPKPS